jgi:hypothetical protein
VAEILKDQVEKMGLDKNPVTQFFPLFAPDVKQKEDPETILQNMTNAKFGLTVRVQFVLIGISQNSKEISS